MHRSLASTRAAITGGRRKSGNEHARAADFLDFVLGTVRKVLRLDDHLLPWQFALAEHFEESVSYAVDHWHIFLLLRVLLPQIVADERPEFVTVDRWAVEAILAYMVVAHAHLAEVARVVLVEVDAVMMLHVVFVTSTFRTIKSQCT